MNENLNALLALMFMAYVGIGFLFVVSGLFSKEENAGEWLWIAPVWPLFWLKFVWKKLRE